MRFILSEDEKTNQVAKEVETHQDIVFLHVSLRHPEDCVADRHSSFIAQRETYALSTGPGTRTGCWGLIVLLS